MKTARFSSAAAMALLGAMLSGCATTRSARIEENARIFAELDPLSQAKIRNGDIDLGFHTEHVYMAIGKPSKVAPLGGIEHGETWSYSNFVIGASSVIALAINNPGTRYQGRQTSANAPRSGGSLFDTRQTGPRPTVDESPGNTATLCVDMVDGVVVRIRLEP